MSSDDSWETKYTEEEIRMIMQTIRDRMKGACPDDYYATFQKALLVRKEK